MRATRKFSPFIYNLMRMLSSHSLQKLSILGAFKVFLFLIKWILSWGMEKHIKILKIMIATFLNKFYYASKIFLLIHSSQLLCTLLRFIQIYNNKNITSQTSTRWTWTLVKNYESEEREERSKKKKLCTMNKIEIKRFLWFLLNFF